MRKSELVRLLQRVDGDPLVVLASDAEGNGFSPLCEAAEMKYLEESTWSGEAYPRDADVDSPGSQYTDEDRAPEGAVPAVVLWPTN